MFSAMSLEKLKIIDGGWPGDNVDRKPKMETSINSSLSYPRINDIIEIIFLVPSGKSKVS